MTKVTNTDVHCLPEWTFRGQDQSNSRKNMKTIAMHLMDTEDDADLDYKAFLFTQIAIGTLL